MEALGGQGREGEDKRAVSFILTQLFADMTSIEDRARFTLAHLLPEYGAIYGTENEERLRRMLQLLDLGMVRTLLEEEIDRVTDGGLNDRHGSIGLGNETKQ